MKCCFCCEVWQPRMKWHFLWLKMSGRQKFESHFIVNGATSPSLCQNCQNFCPNLPTDLWSPSCTRLLFHGNVSAVSPMSTPIFVQATKKNGDTPSSSLKCAFDSSSPLHSIKVYGKQIRHSPEQLAPLIVLNQFRVSETTRMGELRKSIICSVTFTDDSIGE